jgi:hypothetical protein
MEWSWIKGTMGAIEQLTTLRIVRVTVRTGASRLVWVGWVVEVDVLQASGASLVTWLSSHRNGRIIIPVNDDIMSPPNRQIVKESLEILRSIESDGLLGVNGRDLVHVEDLHVVSHGFRANDGEVVEYTDLAPRRTERVLGWQASEVSEFSLLVNFDESGSGVLPDQCDLAALGPDPTPYRRTSPVRVTGVSLAAAH